MSDIEHIKMLHAHIDRQQESQRRLTDVFKTNQKMLIEEVTRSQEEIERLTLDLEKHKAMISELTLRLQAPMKQAIHKLFRVGHYRRKPLLK